MTGSITAFKYFTEEAHAQAFMRWGEMLFKPLAAFRRLEADTARGDREDGALVYAPADGLRLHFTERDEHQHLPRGGFVASAAQHDIFVYCASQTLSAQISEAFHAPYCVEIGDLDGIARALRARASATSALDYAGLSARPIEYRALDAVPLADWALPEKLAFIKPERFESQEEIRIAIGRRGAFEPLNVETMLVLDRDAAAIEPPVDGPPADPPLILRVGDLREATKLHYL